MSGTSEDLDGFMFAGEMEGNSPDVMPLMDDEFVFLGKSEDPPVMPVQGDFDGAGFIKNMDSPLLLRLLGQESRSDDNVSADGLTLFDDWSGIATPARGDSWGY